MINKRTNFFINSLIISLFLIGFTVGNSQAQTRKRRTGIRQELMNKVLKRKYRKSTKKSPQTHLPFNRSVIESQFASWGVKPSNKKSSINLIKAWKKYQNKKEIIVAVIDTGIDPKHPYLKNNIYTVSSKPTLTNYGKDFSKGSKKVNSPFDDHGHGTHVSGIIKSVFPKVKVLSLKYYNKNASGQDNLNSTVEALKYAVENNVDIINYSGGGPEPALEELRVLKKAEKKGILVVAAAGNEESNIDIKQNAYYPASYGLKNIITVTAHDKELKMLRSSNWGQRSVDISAPGYNIKSSLPGLRAGTLTGTSQATAFVTGSAALIMSQYPELSVEEIKNIIKVSAKKEITMTNKCSSGGRLDAGNAQNVAAEYVKKKNSRALAMKRKLSHKSIKPRADRNLAQTITQGNFRNIGIQNKPGVIIYRSEFRKRN